MSIRVDGVVERPDDVVAELMSGLTRSRVDMRDLTAPRLEAELFVAAPASSFAPPGRLLIARVQLHPRTEAAPLHPKAESDDEEEAEAAACAAGDTGIQ